MKPIFIICLFFIALGCKPSAPKQEKATVVATTPKDSIVASPIASAPTSSAIPCTMKGKLVEKFEQNNAVFERLADEQKEMEWLKITTKEGKCFTIDSIGRENQHVVSFEDWDKDGMKDRIDNWKWDYEVALFDKTSNTFSRHIMGRFNGEQWDFDKSQNLKYQFLENKIGGVFELYKLNGANKIILSQIDIEADTERNGNDKIEIKKNINDEKFDIVPMDSKFLAETKPKKGEEYEAHQARLKTVVATYWRKNLSVFMK